jgi:6-phosphogluconolactonase
VPGSPFPAGNNPISLATVNNFLYVSNFKDGTISGYSINPINGALTALAGSPFAIHGGPLVASPLGGFLYTTGPGGYWRSVSIPRPAHLHKSVPRYPMAELRC